MKPPSNLIAGRPKAAILFCLLLVVRLNILARFIVVVFVVSICLVCIFRIVATCPSIQLPALLFVCVLFLLFVDVLSGEPKAALRARVGRPQTSSSPPVIFIAGRPKAVLCFGSLVILDVARCYLWLFTLYINIKIGKNSC